MRSLPAAPLAARTARRAVASAAQAQGFSAEVVATAELLTSELVANALHHAGPPFTLAIREVGGRLRVEVSDCGQDVPRLYHAGPTEVGHRGLLLVDTLSTSWGHHPTGDGGKTVWFELDHA